MMTVSGCECWIRARFCTAIVIFKNASCSLAETITASLQRAGYVIVSFYSTQCCYHVDGTSLDKYVDLLHLSLSNHETLECRHVPEQMWYTHPAFAIALGGVLPFGAVCIELFFIMSALWLHQVCPCFGTAVDKCCHAIYALRISSVGLVPVGGRDTCPVLSWILPKLTALTISVIVGAIAQPPEPKRRAWLCCGIWFDVEGSFVPLYLSGIDFLPSHGLLTNLPVW